MREAHTAPPPILHVPRSRRARERDRVYSWVVKLEEMTTFLPEATWTGLFGLAVALLATAIAFLVQRFELVGLLFRKVDKESERHGGELVAAVLKAHGVKFIFTLCGGHISPVLVACEREGIRVVDTRFEGNAAFAADAVSRLSGVIGVACVTAGPGVTNTVTALQNAKMAESPVLLLGGASANALKGRGALQDIDQLSLCKSLCKHVATVTRVRDIVPALRRAIYVAQSGVPGPAFLELPIDTLYPYKLVRDGLFPKTPAKSFGQKVTNWYLENYLNRLFAGAWVEQSLTPILPTFPRHTPNDITEVANLLRRAQKPVFLLGSQVTLPPSKAENLKLALESIGIPCFLGGMARGLLGQNSALHIRQRRKEALKDADVVLCAGAVADFRLSYGRVFKRSSQIVMVNRSKSNLTMNTDVFFKVKKSVHGDPGCFLLALSQALRGYACPGEWVATLQSRDSEREEENWKKSQELPEQHLNPLNVLYLTEQVMSEDSVIVADGGDFVGSAAYILRPRGPLRWLDPGPYGTLGVGGGFALGAKLCRPDSDVWIIYGDGALGFSVPEFDTFTRFNLPVVALVGNDACWTQIAREQIPMFKSKVACFLDYSSYETVAEGFGGRGFLLDRDSDNAAIRDTLRQAQEVSRREKKPVLINCLIGKTNFREGSISV